MMVLRGNLREELRYEIIGKGSQSLIKLMVDECVFNKIGIFK